MQVFPLTRQVSPRVMQLSLAAILTPLTIFLLLLFATVSTVGQEIAYNIAIVPFGIVTSLSLESPFFFFPVAIALLFLLHLSLINSMFSRKLIWPIAFFMSYIAAIPLMDGLYGYLF